MNSKIMDIGICLVLICMFGLKKMVRNARIRMSFDWVHDDVLAGLIFL